MESRARRGSVVGPVLLIGAGVLFLLHNLGILGWEAWSTLFRLWPVLLIAIGLEILLGQRSLWGSLLIALALIAVVVMAIGPFVGKQVVSRDVIVEEISQPLQGAARAEVDIRAGAGELRLSAIDQEEADRAVPLIEGQIALPEGVEIDRDVRLSGDTLYYTLHSRGAANPLPLPLTQQEWQDLAWDLQLNREVPVRLRLNTGVGKAVVDLSRINLVDLRADVGVGEATLTLPRQGKLEAEIQAGVGKLTVIVPQGMAARIQVRRGLGSVVVRGDYKRDGDTYTSPGYDMAVNRIDLELRCGLGEVVVR